MLYNWKWIYVQISGVTEYWYGMQQTFAVQARKAIKAVFLETGNRTPEMGDRTPETGLLQGVSAIGFQGSCLRNESHKGYTSYNIITF